MLTFNSQPNSGGLGIMLLIPLIFILIVSVKGKNGNFNDSMHKRLLPDTGGLTTWTKLSTLSTIWSSSGRYNHASAQIGNTVYVAGGRNANGNVEYLFCIIY